MELYRKPVAGVSFVFLLLCFACNNINSDAEFHFRKTNFNSESTVDWVGRDCSIRRNYEGSGSYFCFLDNLSPNAYSSCTAFYTFAKQKLTQMEIIYYYEADKKSLATSIVKEIPVLREFITNSEIQPLVKVIDGVTIKTGYQAGSLSKCYIEIKFSDRPGISGNELLLSSGSELIMEEGEKANGYYKDRDRFIKPYTSVSISGDTITATTLHGANACLETTGMVSFSNDTIYLLVKEEGKESCTSTVFKKFTYLIRKPDGKIPVIKF